MKYLQKILLAIIISAPLSVFVLVIGEFTLDYVLELEREYTDTFATIISLPIFFAIVYIVYGLPTTLIADGFLRLKPLSKYRSLIEFIIYSIAGLVLSLLLSSNSLSKEILVIVMLPVYLYLYVLTLMRKKDRKELNIIKT
ncbi:hypothetical protein [Guptibacillus hwajinpoensis]|uniref:Uncharacterized protein n=1 Tax=Guptibacillus hwajinpoensis TaxID=208199 RepID=A0A0J6CZD4_9BACL|nr:hypothetical protein [Alkalihalobacillus macyae]KMM38475.1 hypothetical protein AB986_04030 [Alkalihalobacillus macyae]